MCSHSLGIKNRSHSFNIAFVLILATFCIGVFQLKKSCGQKDMDVDLDGKINPIEQEECAANDDENSECQAGDMETNLDEISQHMATAVTVDNGGLAAKSGGKPHESGAKLEMQNSDLAEVCNAGLRFFHMLLVSINYWIINPICI